MSFHFVQFLILSNVYLKNMVIICMLSEKDKR